MNHSWKTRAISMLLAVVMVFGMLPMSAFAADAEQGETIPAETIPAETAAQEQGAELLDEGEVPAMAEYTVEHHLQNEDGTYSVSETETKTGNVDAATEAAAKTIEGYTAQKFDQTAIAADGSTVVVIRYDRVVEQAPATAEYTVEHHLQNEDGTYSVSEAETKTGNVDAATEAAAKTIEGYTAQNFDQAVIVADGSTVVVIRYDRVVEQAPATAEYTVEHHLQNEDGTYSVSETETKTGNVDAATEAAAKTIEGYTAQNFDQAVVAADGSTVVVIRYDRVVEQTPAIAEYTVKHYLQNEEGSYDLAEELTQILSGEVGTETQAEAQSVEGYEAQEFEQAAIAADGSTVVEICYNMEVVLLDSDNSGFPANMTVLQDKESNLAPGITERQVKVYDKNGNKVTMFVATADTTEDTVKIYANYKDNQPKPFGMQKTTEQAAAFEAKHEGENVIVAINASYFNVGTGQPTGAFVMEGVDASANGDGYPFFALLKDGTYMIGSKGEYSTYKDQIQEAIGGYIHLVKDGAICSGLNTVDKYPRQTIGITEDNQVILMTADCLAAVGSVGLTVQEQAEVMLALGCVEALHLDGGGSATYCSKPAGSDTLVVTNSPSNGSERSVSNTLIIVSTAVPDGTFDRAILTAEYGYITPGSSTAVTAIGVDASGGAAEIPEEAFWQLSDSGFGTVENGVFTSNGTLGAAEIQLVCDSKVVGSTIVEVVNPDRLDFSGRESITVPYGKTVDLGLVAYYDVNEVFYSVDDFEIVLENASAAVVNGLMVTAPAADSGVTETNVTASLKADPSVTATAALVFGKGSEVIFDFEKDTAGTELDNWILRTHESKIENNEQGEIYIVNEKTGRVHDGDQALAFHADFSQSPGHSSNTGGYIALSLSWGGEPIAIKGAQSVGFWLYVPEDAVTTEVTLNTVYYDANGTPQRRTVDTADDDGELIYTPYWATRMEESGWHYVKADFSEYTNDLLIKDEPALSGAYKRNFFIKIFCVFGDASESFADYQGDFTYYIDNITVDYSNAVEDRELPVFGSAYAYGSGSEKALAYGQTVAVGENTLTFAANVADNMVKSNYSGLDAGSAKVYIDGNAVGANYANGMISSDSVTLADGYHVVKFEIADANGNVKTILRSIQVAGGSNQPTVSLVPHDPTLDRLLSGSVYWVDLISEDIAKLQSVRTVLNLNSLSEWELDHMIVSDGFDAAWSATQAQAVEKDVAITFTRNDEELDSSSNIIASIPIRIWDSRTYEAEGLESNTPYALWAAKCVNHRQLRVKVTQGLAIFTDNTRTYFSDNITVDHEAYTDYYLMDATYYAEKLAAGGYHTHTAAAMDDVAATCTENGYTGRTFCSVCNSVVSWGATLKATGHSYAITEGVLQCACGELFTGIWDDGKEYISGICVADGWKNESYYKDGVKLTGIQKVPAPDSTEEFYYNFGADGICANRIKYDGLFLDEAENVYRYAKMGVVTSGWQMIDNEWYYFDADTMAAATGTYQYTEDIVYEFAQTGKLTTGYWAKTLHGTKYYYGPGAYHNGWQVIDGKTYYFIEYYRLEGYRLARESGSQILTWYNFGQDGALIPGTIPDGFYHDGDNGLSYVRNGIGLTGEQVIDGVYYGFDWKGYAQTGEFAGRLYGEDYKAVTGIVEKDGGLYYYENGKPKMAGLIEVDGSLYFASGDGRIVTGEYYVWQGNGILPESTREFGADGKMLEGVVQKDDGYYYFEKGQPKMAGLIEVDGAYYFAKGNGVIVTNQVYYVWQGNGILPESDREFGPDGKMLDGVVKKDDGYYYYDKGQPKMAGLVCVDGDYYFARTSDGKVVTDQAYYVWKSNGLMPEGTYSFDAEGKMRDGIVEIDGGYYYYEGGKPKMAGLIEIDGCYYFAKGDGVVVTNQTYYVWQGNGLLPESNRTFGADGKMLNGIVKEENGYRYYDMGQPKMAGLVEVDGSYYFAKGDGVVITDQTYYVWQGNGIIPESDRTFGADGRMLNGIVEKDGGYFYYNMGKSEMAGLVEIDGGYYFAKDTSGTIVTDQTYYVWKSNGLLPESDYTFDAQGRMLDGFVTREDGIYYYENGKIGTVGLNYIDGYYYFVGVDGKLVTNRMYYVWKTNGLTIAMNYTFDAQGRIVL